MRQFVFLFAMVGLVAGCQQMPRQKPTTTLSDQALAKIAFTSGDYAAASRLYQKAIDSALPTDDIAPLLISIARTYRLLQQPETALNYLSKIEQPTSERWQLEGRCQLDKKEYAAAEAAFNKALKLNKQALVSLNGIAVAQSWLGKYGAAETNFAKALAIAPDNRSYISNRGLNLIMLGKSAEAIALINPVYQRGQSTARMRSYLAMALLFEQQQARARSVLTQDYFGQQLTDVINYFNGYVKNASLLTPAAGVLK